MYHGAGILHPSVEGPSGYPVCLPDLDDRERPAVDQIIRGVGADLQNLPHFLYRQNFLGLFTHDSSSPVRRVPKSVWLSRCAAGS